MVWNGVRDLEIIGNYVKQNWSNIYLYGSSLGAYFGLLAYKDFPIKNCLFLSPVIDMERLIQNMMKQNDVSEQMLKENLEIHLPGNEVLYWDYYSYVKENPINKWAIPTAILYGSEDNLIEFETIRNFTERFNCDLTVLEGSEHWFHTEQQLNFLHKWYDKYI